MSSSTKPNTKTITLIGLMGSGKTSIGKRFARAISLPFRDADAEIVADTKSSISDIFKLQGEIEFRKIEEKIIADLLLESQHVLATGGGAFINQNIRQMIKQQCISIWLRADLDILLERTSRRHDRPLLEQGDSRKILGELISARYPIYAEADITINTGRQPHQEIVEEVLHAYRRLARTP